MERFLHIYLLDCINRDLGWFVTFGEMPVDTAQLYAKEFDEAVTSVSRQELMTLADGFGIPPNCCMMAAPMLQSNI